MAFSLNVLSTWLPFKFALSLLRQTFGEYVHLSYLGTPLPLHRFLPNHWAQTHPRPAEFPYPRLVLTVPCILCGTLVPKKRCGVLTSHAVRSRCCIALRDSHGLLWR